jgi:ubiquinone/menaquinone biosynthesis C-methylase UbiE
VAGVCLWWRRASRNQVIPCPAWLAGTLINPFSRWIPPALDRLELEPGLRVLDVGSGPGRLSIPVAQAVGPKGEVVALDLQPGMIRLLDNRIAASNARNVCPLLADITRGPVEQGTFDRALLVTVLGEIPDREAAMRSIFESLKPGGILSVTEILGDPHYQSRETVRRLAEDAGFRLRREYPGLLSFTINLEKPAA